MGWRHRALFMPNSDMKAKGLTGMQFTIKWLSMIVIFFAVLEFCARIDDKLKYDAPLVGQYSPDILRSYDSDGVPHNIPNARFEKWHNDSLGFREPEIALTKPDKTIRVVCMGTSESYGLYERPGNEWPSQLAGILASDSSFQVINASIVGLPLYRFKDYIEKYVCKVSPDIMILLFNPWTNSIETLRKKEMQKNTFIDGQKMLYSGVLSIGNLTRELRIPTKITLAIKAFMPPALLKRYQSYISNKQIAGEESFRLNGKRSLDTIPDYCATSFQAQLQGLLDYLRNKNIKVILMSYPTLITHENMTQYPDLGIRRFCVEFSLVGMLDVSRTLDQTTEDIAKLNNITFLPLNNLIPKNTDYFADGVHFTDKGAEFVANKVASIIRQIN
jgi:hypothetical protein